MSIRQRLRDQANTDRRCDHCRKGIDTSQRLGSLCPTCEGRRARFGSVKVTKALPRHEWQGAWRCAWAALNGTGPSGKRITTTRSLIPPDIQQAVLALMVPPALPPKHEQRSSNPQFVLWRELVWRQSAEARKKPNRHVNSTVHYSNGRYRAVDLLAVLLALTIYTEERPAQFPHESAEIARARALLDLWKSRPHRPRTYTAKVAKRYKTGVVKDSSWRRKQYLPGSVTRLLAERIRQSAVGLYLLVEARKIIAATAKQKPAPRKPTLPPPTLIVPARPLTIAERLMARYPPDKIENR